MCAYFRRNATVLRHVVYVVIQGLQAALNCTLKQFQRSGNRKHFVVRVLLLSCPCTHNISLNCCTQHNTYLAIHAGSQHITTSSAQIQHESQSFASPRLRSRLLPSLVDFRSTEESLPGRGDTFYNFRRSRSPPHSSRSVNLSDFWPTNPVGYFSAISYFFKTAAKQLNPPNMHC